MKSIPSPASIRDPQLRMILSAMTEEVEVIGGVRGNILDRALTVRDLVNLGLLGVENARLYDPNAAPVDFSDQEDAASATVRKAVTAYLNATAGLAIGAHGMGVVLPENSYIVRAWYEVITTFQSATDAATIQIGVAADDPAGIMPAVAIAHATNRWDAGVHDTLADEIAANFTTKTTAEREIVATVGVQALTAGMLKLFIEYVVT